MLFSKIAVHSFVCRHSWEISFREIFATRHRQGVSLPSHRKTGIDFKKTCGTDRFGEMHFYSITIVANFFKTLEIFSEIWYNEAMNGGDTMKAAFYKKLQDDFIMIRYLKYQELCNQAKYDKTLISIKEARKKINLLYI